MTNVADELASLPCSGDGVPFKGFPNNGAGDSLQKPVNVHSLHFVFKLPKESGPPPVCPGGGVQLRPELARQWCLLMLA